MVLNRQNKMTAVTAVRKQGAAIAVRDPEITDSGQCCVIPSNFQRL